MISVSAPLSSLIGEAMWVMKAGSISITLLIGALLIFPIGLTIG